MSLTEAGQMAKKMIPFVILVIIVLLIFFFGIRLVIILVQNQNASDPNATPTPFVMATFSQIPRPQLSEALPSSRFSNYFLDTLDGTTISATASGNVYFLPQSTANLTYRSRAFSMAKAIGFDTESAQYDDDRENEQAIYKDGKRTLTIDTKDFNFSYEYKLTNNDPMLKTQGLPSETSITTRAVSFLKSINKYPQELSQGTPTVVYIQYDTRQKQLKIVDSPEEANMAEVDFRRPDQPLGKERVPVVSPNYFNTQNYVVMIFDPEDQNEYKVVRAKINFFPKSDDQIGVYPLKTGDQAWKDLTEGRGHIVSLPPDDTERVNIKNMFIGYLNPEGYEPYLQPVYVFLGENNYVAYVPAIQDLYLIEPEPKESDKKNATKSATRSEEDEEPDENEDADLEEDVSTASSSIESTNETETNPNQQNTDLEEADETPDTDLDQKPDETEIREELPLDLEETPTEEVLQEDTTVR